ncbi:MAG: DUF3108 domain-containing protein [Verrucomicrobia bacterium]|nr:DUF3108 domain-containing protein [Verrucomicrobiota bacterium]
MLAVTFMCVALTSLGAESKKSKAKKAKPPPEWLKEITLTKPGNEPALKPCRIRYSLSWNNLINAGEVSISMKDGERGDGVASGTLAGKASARSSGLARVLWAYDCELNSVVDKSTLRPLWFEHSETENSETVSYRTDFKSDRVVTIRRENDEETGEVKSKKRTFKYANVYDLLSSILCLRSLPLAKGDVITGVIQPFDAPYLVNFEVQGRESRKYQGEERDTIRMGVKIQKINKDLTLKAYKKMKTATLWISEDDYRLPLEIRADIFIGYVAATLLERKFLDEADLEKGVVTEQSKKSSMKALISEPAAKVRQWWLKRAAKQKK